MVFHFGITEAAHDGQQVGAVDVGDTELVPTDLGLASERAFRKQQPSDRDQSADRTQGARMRPPI